MKTNVGIIPFFKEHLFFIFKKFQAIVRSYKQIYYSQFGEDVVLRVLVGDKPKKGFYVDVGAYHPKHLSNTYFFYKKGWRGVNIDANPNSMKLFKVLRPRDINLATAISNVRSGNTKGEVTFYSWNSVYDTISKEESELVTNKIGPPKWSAQIKTESLGTILDRYVPRNQVIDILNIDVEGCDFEVLQSNDWQKYRPRFIVIEDHSSDIVKILNSEKIAFLETLGYRLRSWTIVSLIFIRNEDAV